MKIAITSLGIDLDAALDSRFGRAKQFIIFDTTSKEFTVINNEQNLNATQGAGIQSAQNIINSNAEVLITGHCGPKAFRTLNAGEIKIYYAEGGTITENIRKFTSGELKLASDADVEAHWA